MQVLEIVRRLRSQPRLKLLLSVVLPALIWPAYLFIQRHPLYPPVIIQPSFLDRMIPFAPGSFYLYESILLLMPIAPWLMNTKEELRRYVYGLLLITTVCCLIFTICPTSIVRPKPFPGINPFYLRLINIENELNALPSLHAALSVFHGFSCQKVFDACKARWFIWIWVMGILASTLLTKEHTMADMVAGALLAVAAYGVCEFRNVFFPGLLETRAVGNEIFVIKDGFINFYLLKTSAGLVCIDAGWRASHLLHSLSTLGFKAENVKAVFLTHLHWDHSRSCRLFAGAQIFIGEKEGFAGIDVSGSQKMNYRTLKDGESITIGDLEVEPIETPGHTRGSMSYLVGGRFLFTGDLLSIKKGEVLPFPVFNRDRKTLRRSIRKVAARHGVEWLLTAHHGVTIDAAAALRPWRDPPAPLKEGVSC